MNQSKQSGEYEGDKSCLLHLQGNEERASLAQTPTQLSYHPKMQTQLSYHPKILTPLPVQISASNFHELTQITQRRVCFNPKRTEKPKAHGFSIHIHHSYSEKTYSSFTLLSAITLHSAMVSFYCL